MCVGVDDDPHPRVARRARVEVVHVPAVGRGVDLEHRAGAGSGLEDRVTALYAELAAKGLNNTGTENYGGPVTTASGLLFIAATIFDKKIRAFDSSSGQLLWEAELPYSGTATPATYMVDGRQYVVIAASGGRDPKQKGAAYVAFALE